MCMAAQCALEKKKSQLRHVCLATQLTCLGLVRLCGPIFIF